MRRYTWVRHNKLLDHVYDRLFSAEIGREYRDRPLDRSCEDGATLPAYWCLTMQLDVDLYRWLYN